MKDLLMLVNFREGNTDKPLTVSDVKIDVSAMQMIKELVPNLISVRYSFLVSKLNKKIFILEMAMKSYLIPNNVPI